MKLGKKKHEEIQEIEKTSDEELIACLGIHGYQVPEGYTQIESYPLNPPFSYAYIFQDDSEGKFWLLFLFHFPFPSLSKLNPASLFIKRTPAGRDKYRVRDDFNPGRLSSRYC
jgi:hypothetical protein